MYEGKFEDLRNKQVPDESFNILTEHVKHLKEEYEENLDTLANTSTYSMNKKSAEPSEDDGEQPSEYDGEQPSVHVHNITDDIHNSSSIIDLEDNHDGDSLIEELNNTYWNKNEYGNSEIDTSSNKIKTDIKKDSESTDNGTIDNSMKDIDVEMDQFCQIYLLVSNLIQKTHSQS